MSQKPMSNSELGISIMASIAVDPKHDGDLAARDVSELFPSSTAYVSFRKSAYLRKIEIDFMRILSPKLTRNKIVAAREARPRLPPRQSQ